MRKLISPIFIFLAVIAVNIPTLFRGNPESAYWVYGETAPLGIFGAIRFINGDEVGFVSVAQDLDFFDQGDGTIRQNRVAYVFIGWLATLALRAVTFGQADHLTKSLLNLELQQFAFILINALILTTAVMLLLAFKRSVPGATWGPTLFGAILVTANPVTRAYFWSAHTQMFNVTLAIFAVAICALLLKRSLSSFTIFLIGLGLGFLILMYGTFVLITVTGVALLMLRKQFQKALLLSLGTIAPVISWIMYVTLRAGEYYSVETEQWRQFVWVLDGINSNTLLELGKDNLNRFFLTLTDAQTVFALVLSFVILAIAAWISITSSGADTKISDLSSWLSTRELGILLAVFGTGFVIFVGAMGYYQNRLTWGLVSTAVVISVILATLISATAQQKRSRMTLNLIPTFLGGIWLATWLAIQGPWS